jgi:hypothetical protein
MARRLLFSVVTPLGYRVVLTRDRWREIYRSKHRSLSNQENIVRACLHSPRVITRSTKEEDVHLYYRPSYRAFICVVVARRTETEYLVRTAYFTARMKKGEVLWEQ